MLKALMLRKKIDDKKKAMAALIAKDETLKTREAELESSINEAETEEEQAVVSEAVEAFETEKKEHEEAKSALENEISGLEQELGELEADQRSAAVPAQRSAEPVEPAEKKEVNADMRKKFFGLDAQERDAMMTREDVKSFIAKVRECMAEQRSITNVGLTIPQVLLQLLKPIVEQNSKLYGKVTSMQVSGTSRQTVMGTILEAVWTEMCATLNELNLGFTATEMDGYKVGGYIPVCNAMLEDSDADLAQKIVEALGAAIAKALDKAIIYGTGTKMPLGVVTRLAQSVQPSGYSAKERPWVDLHTSNMITGTGLTGLALFKAIAKNKKITSNEYSDRELTWCMSKNTHDDLIAESMDKNLNAAIVAGMNGTMPVLGGQIVELSCIPDGDIVFGYFDLYLLAERAGTKIEESNHYRFVEDQTVFKATARYDGKPVIAEAFGVINIGSSAPSTTPATAFAGDTANA